MIHKTSDVQTKKIGRATTIWQYVVVLEGAVIGLFWIMANLERKLS